MIKEVCDLTSSHFQLDFEIAVHKAIKATFPAATIRCCRFHLAQAWNRKIQKLGLQATYQGATSQTAVWLKSIFGLPGLPPSKVELFFTATLSPLSPKSQPINAFKKYILETYVSSTASFPPHMWAGVLDTTSQHTTNGCESFHRHFGTGFTAPHPSIFDWLSVLNMHHKRSMIKSKNISQERPVTSLLSFLLKLKDEHEAGHIDQLSFVKIMSLNMLPASKTSKNKRQKAFVNSIKKSYIRRMSHILS